ncbi:MAG: glycoside hydrolase family 57 [Methylococcaceae bacterium]
MNKIINHGLVLNLHQPAGNLDFLLEHQAWEAKEILYAIDRMPRTLLPYDDIARVHLSLSGTLLETLSDPDFQQRAYGIVDCGSLLWQLQNQNIFNILGTGYYHPVLPLIPRADREEHLIRWLGIAKHLLWRDHFEGFWPPEMGFNMELIPLLKKMGYQYVLVDSLHVEAITPMTWHELRYRPHIAKYEGEEIIIVVRDRDLSDAQESGMEYGWFASEATARTKYCDFSPLIVTCTDGDNGGWFRNTTDGSNFWTAFYQPLLDAARASQEAVQPCFIHEYIKRYGVLGEVTVNTGAWNTGAHDGLDFIQWTGSQAQKDGLVRIKEASQFIHDMRWDAGQRPPNKERDHEIEQAMWRLLRAETSCNFYWGEDWVDRCHQDLDEAWMFLYEKATP